MCVFRWSGFFLLTLLLSGCVSLSRYNERVEQVRYLEGEATSLEATLKHSENARKGLEIELQGARRNLAKLQEEHEALKARSVAAARESEGNRSDIDAEKQQFSQELAALIAKLAEADDRIRKLSALLAAKEEAARRIPSLEAAIAEREQRIKELTVSLHGLETHISQIKKDATELSRRRNGTEEKERAAVAIRSVLSNEISQGEVGVREFRDKVIVTMKEQILFPSGSARISRNGQRTLDRMAKVLRKVNNNQILVEGHTDSVPVRKAARYRSNWDLSAARAANVITHLEKKGKIRPQLLALAGYSCYLPAARNDCEKNRRLNRRIEITLLPLETERLAAVKQTTAMKLNRH